MTFHLHTRFWWGMPKKSYVRMPLKAFMVLKLVVFDDCAPCWY